MAGEMYEAVTRCFRLRIHSSATKGWKGTGRRLDSIIRLHSEYARDEVNIPDDNIRLCDQPLHRHRIAHVHEHRCSVGIWCRQPFCI